MTFSQKINIFSGGLIVAILFGGFLFLQREKDNRRPALLFRPEIEITIIPGWNLKQIAENLVQKNIVSTTVEFYQYAGYPVSERARVAADRPLNFLSVARLSTSSNYGLVLDKPPTASFEGYFFPDTYRIYADATVPEVIQKVFGNLEKKINAETRISLTKQKKNLFNILILASLVEKEARTSEDMKMVADILIRRQKIGWALQLCSSVNYVTGKSDFAVTGKDKKVDSPYNTYQNADWPPGPISNPGLAAIQAAISLTPNDYWYFMTGNDGVMRYAKTLEEHNVNVARYLR